MVSVNWRLAPPEVLQIVNDAEAEILFVGEEYFAVVEKIRDQLKTVRRIVTLGPRHDDWEGFRRLARPPSGHRSSPAGPTAGHGRAVLHQRHHGPAEGR
jgi:acyl-CoA synthetase (AMP-forming)/AMP-acid ligase II